MILTMMATDRNRVFDIICYNMRGFHQGPVVVDDLIVSHNPDVFVLQEHWLTPANLHLFDSHFKA